MVDVGIRSTTLLTRDEILIVVPNSVLNSAMVINQSAPQRRRRLKLELAVAYGTDLDEFEALVLDVAAEERNVIEDREPRMRFRRFGDSALEYELVCWIRSPTAVGRTRHALNREICERLRDADIEVPFTSGRSTVAGPATVRPVLPPSGRRCGPTDRRGEPGHRTVGAGSL